MTDGRVVVVTGAAGAIGSATVDAFLREGYAVLGLDRRPDERTATGYRSLVVDVADEKALRRTIDAVEGAGALAHVVGIAGGALEDEPQVEHDPALLTSATFRASVEANLVTQFLVLQAVLPWLRRSGPGDRSVTFASSFNALRAQGMPAYSAAKAGLLGMVQALVRPLGAEGIRVNAVAPGTIRTPRTERIWAQREGHFERLQATTALGRLGEPSDVAEAFVAVARMRHLTGQVLVVDGGQSAGGLAAAAP